MWNYSVPYSVVNQEWWSSIPFCVHASLFITVVVLNAFTWASCLTFHNDVPQVLVVEITVGHGIMWSHTCFHSRRKSLQIPFLQLSCLFCFRIIGSDKQLKFSVHQIKLTHLNQQMLERINLKIIGLFSLLPSSFLPLYLTDTLLFSATH